MRPNNASSACALFDTSLMAASGNVYVHQVECCIRGYDVYHRIWHPTIGELLSTVRERDNPHDRYAVAVLEDETCQVALRNSW